MATKGERIVNHSQIKVRVGWKVVRKEGSKLLSVTSYGPECCTYRVNKWTRPVPGYGPLCVFRIKKYAKWFNNELNDESVYKCWYVAEKGTKFAYDGKCHVHVDDLPIGTVLAKQVKLCPK